MRRKQKMLKEIGEEYDKKETILYYAGFLLIAILLGMFFELVPVLLFIVALVYVFCVPQIIYNRKKNAFELQRFHDVNAYMRQMEQSFTRTGNLIDSLQETCNSFSTGRMRSTLEYALGIIGNGKMDIVSAEQQALEYIESQYGCEKLRNLHIFIQTARERGGRYDAEFVILEKMRCAWKDAVSFYHNKMIKDRNAGTICYGVLLGVGVIMLNVLRDSDINIINIILTQLANAILLIIFVLYFVFMDKRLNTSLLKETKVMSKESADYYLSYLRNFDSRKERRRYIFWGILSLAIAIINVINNPTYVSMAIGICIVLLGFNVHKLVYAYTKNGMKKEIRKAFPKWLFDVMLLIQRESVEGAIIMSIDSASPVLQEELIRVSNAFSVVPEYGKEYELHNADAYVSFFAEFKCPEIEEAMRNLYSLAVGIGGNGDVMNVMIESNMEFLNKAEKDSIEIRSALQIYAMLPTIIVGVGLLSYMVSTLVVAVQNVINMF